MLSALKKESFQLSKLTQNKLNYEFRQQLMICLWKLFCYILNTFQPSYNLPKREKPFGHLIYRIYSNRSRPSIILDSNFPWLLLESV